MTTCYWVFKPYRFLEALFEAVRSSPHHLRYLAERIGRVIFFSRTAFSNSTIEN